jgi:hypothetical protein
VNWLAFSKSPGRRYGSHIRKGMHARAKNPVRVAIGGEFP